VFTMCQRLQLMVYMGLALISLVSATDSNEDGSTVLSRTKRFLYLPITDLLNYQTTVQLGFMILMLTVIIGLWVQRYGIDGGPTFRMDDISKIFRSRTGKAESWTDEWYGWMPVLNNLVQAMDKYEDTYRQATKDSYTYY
ncbi:unnamed protein product, partial [Meganyctiphanes norvegica]